MTNDVNAPQQGYDVEELLGKIDGLTQQRNTAFDDAANVFSRLKKLTGMFNSLLDEYTKLKAKYEPESIGVPVAPVQAPTEVPAALPTEDAVVTPPAEAVVGQEGQ